MTESRTGRVLNFLAFQAAWAAAVLGAARGWGWAGPAAALAMSAWRLAMNRREVLLLAAAAVLGSLADGAASRLGGLAFASPDPWGLPAPPWIAGLWAAFAGTLNSSMRWARHPVGGVLAGLAGGPLAYAAGARLGAVSWEGSAWQALLPFALAWAVLVPLLGWLARRSDRV